MIKKITFLGFVLLAILSSCTSKSALEKKIAAIPIEVTIERFDLAFAKATPKTLSQLKEVFPFMFSPKYSDSFWIAKMKDTLQQEINTEVEKKYPNLNNEELEIEQFFKHLKYYFPAFKQPRMVSATSYVDYKNSIILTDTISIIAIDTYLGADHFFYGGIPKYLRANFRAAQIVPNLATEYAKKYIPQNTSNVFLDEMIYFGKQLYFKDIMLPFKTDNEKIGYTKAQLDWSVANEFQIWNYLVENEYIFSTNTDLLKRFISNAPFSKFNLVEIDKESPGRIGQFIGWQIVKAYMEKYPSTTLNELFLKPAQELFYQSNYKPKLL